MRAIIYKNTTTWDYRVLSQPHGTVCSIRDNNICILYVFIRLNFTRLYYILYKEYFIVLSSVSVGNWTVIMDAHNTVFPSHPARINDTSPRVRTGLKSIPYNNLTCTDRNNGITHFIEYTSSSSLFTHTWIIRNLGAVLDRIFLLFFFFLHRVRTPTTTIFYTPSFWTHLFAAAPCRSRNSIFFHFFFYLIFFSISIRRRIVRTTTCRRCGCFH